VHTLDDHQVGAAAFIEAVQIRFGLEVVGIELLLFDLQVGLHIIGEHLDLQINAFLGQLRLDQLEDLGMGNRRCRYGEFFSSECLGSQDGGQCSQQKRFFHVCSR